MDEEERVGPPWGMGHGIGWRIALSALLFFGRIAPVVV